MRKFIVLVASMFLVLFAGVGVVFAQSSNSSKIVDVKAGEEINRDFFASGDLVTISGKVNGDVYAFAQKIVINGEINGDLIAAGGEILIPGKVDHDARLAASKISLSGTVDGSVTIGTGEFTFDRNARIGNSAIIATGDTSLQGHIEKGLTIWANKVIIANYVGGPIMAAVTDLTLDPGARIAGDITYWASNNITINEGSDIRGQTYKHEIKSDADAGRNIEKSMAGVSSGFKIYGFLVTLILGLLVIKLMPVYSGEIANTIFKKLFRSFWIGLVALILTPLLLLILFVTIVGIPFAFILLFSLILVLCISNIFVALALGNWLETKFKLNNPQILRFVGGLIILTLISVIPIIGGIFGFIAFFAGFGALLVTTFALQKSLRAKKLI